MEGQIFTRQPLPCLMLKAHSHSRVNERKKSFRQNTSSSWWVPGHFTMQVPQVQSPFQGMGDRDPEVCSGAQRRSKALLTLLSLWKGAIYAFTVGSSPKRLNRGGLDRHVRALWTKTTSHLISWERIHHHKTMTCASPSPWTSNIHSGLINNQTGTTVEELAKGFHTRRLCCMFSFC